MYSKKNPLELNFIYVDLNKNPQHMISLICIKKFPREKNVT
jgi:hypothetical protein